MKNKILFIFFVIFSVGVNAQKVTTDKRNADGFGQLMCSGHTSTIDGIDYNFTLKYFNERYDSYYFFLISSYAYISDDARLLIKLSNDSIVEKVVDNVHIGKVTIPGSSYIIGNVITSRPEKEVDYYSAGFVFSESLLDDIEKYGITKIRLANSRNRYIDKTWVNNSLGTYIKKARKNILKKLSEPIKPKSIYDGF